MPSLVFTRILEALTEVLETVTFLQIGANDGVWNDPIEPYVRGSKGHGVMVEPVPYIFARLQARYRTRADLILENCAVAAAVGEQTFYSVQEMAPDGTQFASAIGSFSLAHVLKHAPMVPQIGNRIQTLRVPCLTVQTVLTKHKDDFGIGTPSTMNRVLVFDVNETLLDLRALDPEFERVFGNAQVRGMWFAQMIQNALVSIVTDTYETFSALGSGALEQVAERLQVKLSPDDRAKILSGMKTLPPHPEVPNALRQLRDAGLRLCALTNNTEEVLQAQFSNAGLLELFTNAEGKQNIYSADSVKRLKPARAPYEFAARQMGVRLGDIQMIAAHAWDVTGAQRAGARAAFIARPGMALDPLAPRPEIVGKDLAEVAAQIIAAH